MDLNPSSSETRIQQSIFGGEPCTWFTDPMASSAAKFDLHHQTVVEREAVQVVPRTPDLQLRAPLGQLRSALSQMPEAEAVPARTPPWSYGTVPRLSPPRSSQPGCFSSRGVTSQILIRAFHVKHDLPNAPETELQSPKHFR